MEVSNYKYLTSTEQEDDWGVNLSVVGISTIGKNAIYPPKGHPNGYNFNVKKGRILNEYQINYITQGSGIFKNKHGVFHVQAGDLIIIFPNQWHTYSPDKTTGWKEHYIGFRGTWVESILKNPNFNPQVPIIKLDYNQELIDIFYKILNVTIEEKSEYQKICSGLIIQYIATIIFTLKNKEFSGTEIEQKIKQACSTIRESIDKNIEIEAIASDLNISYSYFRKMFKKYTSISPSQYHLQLKLKKAESLVLLTNKSVKEIAFELGFDSIFYFSRIFKSKFAVSPSEMRKRAFLEIKNKIQ